MNSRKRSADVCHIAGGLIKKVRAHVKERLKKVPVSIPKHHGNSLNT